LHPKPDGRQRPLGIAAPEDKIVQRACSKTRNGKFVVKRKANAKRLARKLKAIREDMLDRILRRPRPDGSVETCASASRARRPADAAARTRSGSFDQPYTDQRRPFCQP